MKNTIIITVLLFLFMFQITGCKKEETSKKNNSISEKKAITQSVTDTIFDRKNSYYPFIQKNHPELLNYKINFFWEKDLDGDGQNEAIIAFGRDSDTGLVVENILVLKNDNGTIKEIKSDFDFKKYSFSDIQLISLKGKNKSYINLEIFEGPYAVRYAIYEMIDDQIKPFFICPSLDGNHEYDYELIDSDKDGSIDGFVQNINYERFNTKNQFVFENNSFRFKKINYIMDEYPDMPKPVVTQYICIKSLGLNDNTSNRRLQELCIDKEINEIPLTTQNWKSAYLKSSAYEDDAIQIDTDEEKGIGSAKVDFKDSKKNINYQLKFDLQKNGDRWQIIKVELL